MNLLNTHVVRAVLSCGVLVPLFLGCDPPEPVVVERPLMSERTVLTVDMDEPIYSWDARISGTLAVQDCRLTLASDIDGRLWSGQADDKGHWSYMGTMHPGMHQLTFEVVCGGTSVVKYFYPAFVRDNEAPLCRIASPLDGQRYFAGEPIAFIADNWDPDDDEIVELWQSSVNGGLFQGQEWGMALLSVGEHHIRVEAKDIFGAQCWDEVVIYIDIPHAT